MTTYLRTLWRPEVYHGAGKRGNFFEGWYYKIVDVNKKNIFAFIPGISIGKDSHAFIQILEASLSDCCWMVNCIGSPHSQECN